MNLEIAKKIITENIDSAGCGIFNCRNLVGDPMSTIYNENHLMIDICYNWSYFEVFGLTEDEFNDLQDFYEKLLEERKDEK